MRCGGAAEYFSLRENFSYSHTTRSHHSLAVYTRYTLSLSRSRRRRLRVDGEQQRRGAATTPAEQAAEPSTPSAALPITDPVLQHEYRIEDHTGESKAKFDRIARHFAPIVRGVGIEQKLRDGEEAATEI